MYFRASFVRRNLHLGTRFFERLLSNLPTTCAYYMQHVQAGLPKHLNLPIDARILSVQGVSRDMVVNCKICMLRGHVNLFNYMKLKDTWTQNVSVTRMGDAYWPSIRFSGMMQLRTTMHHNHKYGSWALINKL
jgi:hypothetical protein